MQAIYTLLLALFVSMVLVPPLARAASTLGLVDHPGGRKIHAEVIPCTGGIAIVLGTLAPILLWVPIQTRELSAFLVASGVLFVTGLIDDRYGLGYRSKLVGQLLAATITVAWGGLCITYVPFAADYSLPTAIAVPLTIFVLVGVTNAVNLSDGLDGLAGGLCLIALGGLAVLAYQAEDVIVLLLALAMIGATSGFLRFNTYPAQIFMGDTGSQFLGFGVGVLSLMVTQRADSPVGKLVPVLILGIPILDTMAVMARRIAAGRSPFSADRLHIHHRLLALGLSQSEVVALVYLSQGLLVAAAYLLRFSADWAIVLTYLGFASVALGGLALAQFDDRTPTPTPWRKGQRETIDAATGTSVALLANGSAAALALALPILLSVGASLAPRVTLDIAALAGFLIACELLGLVFAAKALIWIDRLTAYVTAVAVVYLASSTTILETHPVWVLTSFVVVGLLVALRIRFSQVAFKASPLDVLILCAAAVLPNLGGAWLESFAPMVIESIVLFYAIEILAVGPPWLWRPLRLGSLSSLGILVYKALL